MKVKIKNASQASQIIKNFLSKMGYSTFVSPVRAEKKGNIWLVEFIVGFKSMQFEVNATTGEIMRYGAKS